MSEGFREIECNDCDVFIHLQEVRGSGI